MLSRVFSSETNKKLASNTLMLSILMFSSYFLALATLPYQARVLGPELFGMVAFAMAFGLYFQILIDFGFTLSATEQVAKHRDDKYKISQIVSTVTWSKLLLTIVAFSVLMILCTMTSPFRDDPLLYVLFALSYTFVAMTPDYFYRGTENMKAIAVRTVIIRAVAVCFIFILLRSPSDYYIVPMLLALGNAVALVYTFWDIWRRGVRLVGVFFGEIIEVLRQSSAFFYSRVAANVYSASNTFILGLAYGPASQAVGFFSSADKLTNAAKYTFTPLVDSLYPHMVRSKDFHLIEKVLTIFVPAIVAISAIVWIFAYDIIAIIFGADFREAGEYLRWLIPVALIAFPTMVLGYPTLSPMGLARFANLSVIAGSVLHIAQLSVLFLTGRLSVITVCVATIITEVFVLCVRGYIVLRARHRGLVA